jgi:hypothetical protein
MAANPLQVGILIDDWRVPAWIAAIVRDIAQSESADIAAVVTNAQAADRRLLPDHFQARPNPFRLAQFYLYLDQYAVDPLPDALAEVDLEEQLADRPVIDATPIFDGPYFRFTEHDDKRLKSYGIDVLLLFWSGLPADDALPLARHGVWYFLDHELLMTGRAPIGFWEVLTQYPITLQCLQARLAASSKAVTLHRHAAPTHARSITLSRNNMLWKSAPVVSRKLNELRRVGSVERLVHMEQCTESSLRGDGPPSNAMLLKTATSHVSRFVRDRLTDLRYFDQWVIGYKYATDDQFLDRDFSAYRWLIPPKDRRWADPFPVRVDGRDFLFFEEIFNSNNRGHLCVAEIDHDGLREDPKVILQRDYHLSYPFVFSWQDNWYLIPESREANRIDVYRFDAFPYEVSYYKTIMDNVNAVDTTLFEADGRWWMFVAIAPPGTWNVDELFLFCAESPFGPWRPHECNPVKSDVRAARPAGRVFTRNGKYYRPAQDCSRGYGYAIRVQELKALSESQYLEEEVESILPGWSSDIVATHTLNVAGSLSAIDARRRRPR